jgi:hypothetical protein
MQIVQHVFDDRKLDTIAFELGISSHTVDTYFQRLYLKLQVGSRSQLILRVMSEYLKLINTSAGVSRVQPPVQTEERCQVKT